MILPKTPSFRLDGKRALVTGASSGIGLGAAAALASAASCSALAISSFSFLAMFSGVSGTARPQAIATQGLWPLI